MPVLIDATVLSNLAAVKRLDLLKLLGDELYLASAVYEEIQRGLEEGYEFLAEVDKALDEGIFDLTTLKGEEEWRLYRRMPGKLQRGEAMSLAIALHRKWGFLTDDRAARRHADRLKARYSGTLGILLLAIKKGHLSLKEADELLKQMVMKARYRSPVDSLEALVKGGRNVD
ncbi:MAG: DUF3368 domain-containing protein [Chloroflexi bacterium]|nr:MAG: DUF3368 domain-containing protein [Chloroflexota bacterium]HDN79832.1 DUF3368 domain-containing protein [Chloroflexota bacterium]